MTIGIGRMVLAQLSNQSRTAGIVTLVSLSADVPMRQLAPQAVGGKPSMREEGEALRAPTKRPVRKKKRENSYINPISTCTVRIDPP